MPLFSLIARRRGALLSLALGCGMSALLAGCGFTPGAPVDAGTAGAQLRGRVHGGQQPVSGATIQLYRAGSTGNGSAAVPLLVQPVTTDAHGFFSITGDYTCLNSSDQVYIVATGGNPGLAGNASNPALVMMAALGNCGDLVANAATTYIFINEMTTVGAAWALAPFMTAADRVGASATNATGLSNAFQYAHLLADTTNGGLATLASNQSVETTKVTTLADALAGCVNSDGTSGCAGLFAAARPAGGTAPTNTLTAALNVVKNPASNVAAVFDTVPSTPPFQPALTHAPSDWTMSLTISGGGLGAPVNGSTTAFYFPTALAVDANGYVWAASYYGMLTAFSPFGVPQTATGYGIGTLNENYGITVDPTGNVWVSNEESSPHHAGSLTKFMGSNSATPGAIVSGPTGATYYDTSINYPLGLASDTTGNIAIANYAASTATVYNSTTGQPVATNLGYGNASFPSAVTYDGSHGIWIANQGDGTLTHVDALGNSTRVNGCCNSTVSVAMDLAGNVWAANQYSASVTEVSPAGVVLMNQVTAGGLSYPAGMKVDAGGVLWVPSFRGSAFVAISTGTGASGAGAKPAGTVLTGANGLGHDASLIQPYMVASDRSGNLWMSNEGGYDVVMFFGVATPTVTPAQPIPVAP